MILEAKVDDIVVRYQGNSEGVYRVVELSQNIPNTVYLKKIADLQGSSVVKGDRSSFKLDTMYFMTVPQYKEYVNDNINKLMDTLGKVGGK